MDSMKDTKTILSEDGSLDIVNTTTDEITNIRPAEVLTPYTDIEWKLTDEIKDQIVDMISNGGTLKKIDVMPGMPPSILIHKWLRLDNDFKDRMALAKEARGEYAADKVFELAEGIEGATREEMTQFKNAADLYKWLAEKNNPKQYGQKQQISGDAAAPLRYIIKSNIDRTPQEGDDGEEDKGKDDVDITDYKETKEEK